MASPLPPDPYAALGISKDADRSAVRIAHRKLALKYHPDRIKNETLREKHLEEFDKIQRAYELLSDPVRRSRYDDRVRLAELRKEAMMTGQPPSTFRSSRSYPIRPPQPQPRQAPPPVREFRDYEDFVEGPRQRKRAPAPRLSKPAENTKKAPPSVPSMAAAAAAAAVEARLFQNLQSSKGEEKRADREKRERSEKLRARRTSYFTFGDLSDSDLDYTENKPSPKTSFRSKSPGQYKSAAGNPRRSTSRIKKTRGLDEESRKVRSEKGWEGVLIESLDANSLDIGLNPSNTYQNGDGKWEGYSRRRTQKSGCDSERQIAYSPQTEDYFTPPPPARIPVNYRKVHVEEGVPSGVNRNRERDQDGQHERYPDMHQPNVVPAGLQRIRTAPIPKASERAAAPSVDSDLKYGKSQTHASGYRSSPHTAERREESPPAKHKSRRTSSHNYLIEVDRDLPEATRSNKMYDESESSYTFQPILAQLRQPVQLAATTVANQSPHGLIKPGRP
ncbi:uncharacterized protein Z520_08924 [Fonsecaea multimorphosa CBS 102226]|uniref:J domain-containing protein n=1 Tax=Fonsecaea multimorphosa CBS 102226 TaxID=1442371 RepID=A0A0D2JPZ4_9EURO|nr:uncharacterized protein Z520_08924 [Fonsecaea multimorphosa CBS 102226]KIX95407.1 hypothetical protein Z520_08924 [Fonsecaea multimorphosa CBS 102226]